MDFKKPLGKVKVVKSYWEVNLKDIISRNNEIDDTDLDGEKVMMNLDKGQYFMMNEVGSRIWEILEESKSVEEIVQSLLNEYEVEKEQCESTVIEFLGQLNKADLISVK